MKHLLTGVAIAAALAIAAPAWAQAPAPAPSGAPAPASAGAPKAAAPTASKQRHKRVVRRRMASHRRGGRVSPGNAMTEQLNREELARIQGGGMPAPPPPPGPYNAGAGQGGPRASGH